MCYAVFEAFTKPLKFKTMYSNRPNDGFYTEIEKLWNILMK
jgi:hypothetical protein